MIRLGTTQSGQEVALSTKALTTHSAILGMTGSGKTGMVLNIAEELIRNSIPLIILDIKGDMTNLFDQKDKQLLQSMAPRVISPGADYGEPVNVTSGLSNPEKISESVTALLKLINIPSDPLKSRQHALVSTILEDRHAKRQKCRLLDLVVAIQEPPFDQIGVMELDEVISKASRKALAAKLNNILVAKNFENWLKGTTLDISSLIQVKHINQTPAVVYSVAHLTSDHEREFAISLLLNELVTYMRSVNGVDNLQLAFIVDECYGLMPPKGNANTKGPLLSLLKQGRAAGIGVVLATQNPMDLDYKGMANCGTWIIGKLQTANDRKRIIEGVCSAVPGFDKKRLEKVIGGLNKRHFLVSKGTEAVSIYSREVTCNLTGPMEPTQIKALLQSTQDPSAIQKILSIFK